VPQVKLADRANITLHEDRSYGMRRVEVTCAACAGHFVPPADEAV
jgi:peptide methionine sulfoxide reductase MsrB